MYGDVYPSLLIDAVTRSVIKLLPQLNAAQHHQKALESQ